MCFNLVFVDHQRWRGTRRSEWSGQAVQHPWGLRRREVTPHVKIELWHQPVVPGKKMGEVIVNYFTLRKYFRIWNFYEHVLFLFYSGTSPARPPPDFMPIFYVIVCSSPTGWKCCAGYCCWSKPHVTREAAIKAIFKLEWSHYFHIPPWWHWWQISWPAAVTLLNSVWVSSSVLKRLMCMAWQILCSHVWALWSAWS